MRFSTRALVHCALLVALSIVLTRILKIETPSLRLSFGMLPIILAGLMWGPVAGGMVGLVADLLGCVLFSQVPFPLITVASVTQGVLPALLLGRSRTSPALLPLLLVMVVTDAIASIGITTYALTQLLHAPFEALVGPRLVARAIITPITWLFIQVIMRRLNPTNNRSISF